MVMRAMASPEPPISPVRRASPAPSAAIATMAMNTVATRQNVSLRRMRRRSTI